MCTAPDSPTAKTHYRSHADKEIGWQTLFGEDSKTPEDKTKELMSQWRSKNQWDNQRIMIGRTGLGMTQLDMAQDMLIREGNSFQPDT